MQVHRPNERHYAKVTVSWRPATLVHSVSASLIAKILRPFSLLHLSGTSGRPLTGSLDKPPTAPVHEQCILGLDGG